jgi:hypothetical protein
MLKVSQHIPNVTEGSEWTRYLVLDTLEDSCLATTLLQKTKPHTFLLRFHFMFTRNEHFPATFVAGHRSTRRNCVRPHKSVWHTDLTTQHVYPTVKVTKQVQDMHVARTVIAERGPACACRQRMAVSFPSLASCHRWLLERGKAEAGYVLCSISRWCAQRIFFTRVSKINVFEWTNF